MLDEVEKIYNKLDEIKSKLDEETLSKVGPSLQEVRNTARELGDGKLASDSESKQRKIKLRELETEREDYQIKIDELNKKIESATTPVKEIESQLSTYKKKYEQLLEGQKSSFVNFVEKYHKDSRWEKAQNFFKLPEKTEEGYKFDQWKPETEDIERNVAEMQKLNNLEYFKDSPTTAMPVDKSKGHVMLDGKVVPSVEDVTELGVKYGRDSVQYNEALTMRRKAGLIKF